MHFKTKLTCISLLNIAQFRNIENHFFDSLLLIFSDLGELNAFRKNLINKAYKKLDVNGDGQVKLDDIAQIYDASKHPDVLDGKKTKDQVLLEFMDKWDTQEKDGIITIEEFYDYFSDVSASIDTDEYFEAMMKSAWKI